jgi:alpha-L-rhamnosidase
LAPSHRHAALVRALTDEANLVHAAFSVADGPSVDAEDSDVGGVYLLTGPPPPWWDTEHQIVRAQPFFQYVVHDALAAAGRADLVAGLCRDWLTLLSRAETTWSETWYAGTVSHGWSSTPTRDLVQHVLGVTPGEPGFARARVAPALGGLEWARGRVPTPSGMLDVEVTTDRLVVSSPVPVDAVFDGEVVVEQP